MDFKGILRKNIAPMILAGTMSGSVLGGIPLVSNATECSSIVAEVDEQTKLSGLFDEKNDAKEWIKEKKQILEEAAYQVTGTKIYVYEGCLKNTETILIDEIYISEDYALEHLENLKDNDYYQADIEMQELIETTETVEKVNLNQVFDSMDELNSYIDSLEEKNNLVLNVTVIPGDWDNILEEKIYEISKESKDELDECVNLIKDEIKNAETQNLLYDVRVEESVSDQLVPSAIVEENFSMTFDSKEAALDFINEKKLEIKNNEDKQYDFDEIVEKSKISIIENSNVSEEFNTIEELNSYIEMLNNDGYKLNNIKITDNVVDGVNRYYLDATIFKEETNLYYELNYTLKTQQYENKTIYSSTIYRIIKSKKDMYSLTGSYDEIKEEQVTLYNLTGKMYRTISSDRYRSEIRYKQMNDEIELETPDTSDKSNILAYSAILVGSTASLLTIKSKVKKKKRK